MSGFGGYEYGEGAGGNFGGDGGMNGKAHCHMKFGVWAISSWRPMHENNGT